MRVPTYILTTVTHSTFMGKQIHCRQKKCWQEKQKNKSTNLLYSRMHQAVGSSWEKPEGC